MSLAPALVRLVTDVALDQAHADDAWEMASSLVGDMDVEEARRVAWEVVLFTSGLLARLDSRDPEIVDVDALVAEWGLSCYARGLGLEARP